MENIRAIILMTIAMAAFAIADMFIKLNSHLIPVGEIIVYMGLGGALVFAVITKIKGENLWTNDLICFPVAMRNLGEIVGTGAMLTALSVMDFNMLSSILQAAPLLMTFGAALFLKEQVGWRRWSAILVGFIGVLIIIRPGMAGFEITTLLGIVAMIGISVRDLSSRSVPKSISTPQLSIYSFLSIIPVGIVFLIVQAPPVMPSLSSAVELGLSLAFVSVAYFAITSAMRIGDVSVVAPFRYTRLLFALTIGVLVFHETIDIYMIVGSCIVIASGLYTFARERIRAT